MVDRVVGRRGHIQRVEHAAPGAGAGLVRANDQEAGIERDAVYECAVAPRGDHAGDRRAMTVDVVEGGGIAGHDVDAVAVDDACDLDRRPPPPHSSGI
jgi:hypothetical protein